MVLLPKFQVPIHSNASGCQENDDQLSTRPSQQLLTARVQPSHVKGRRNLRHTMTMSQAWAQCLLMLCTILCMHQLEAGMLWKGLQQLNAPAQTGVAVEMAWLLLDNIKVQRQAFCHHSVQTGPSDQQSEMNSTSMIACISARQNQAHCKSWRWSPSLGRPFLKVLGKSDSLAVHNSSSCGGKLMAVRLLASFDALQVHRLAAQPVSQQRVNCLGFSPYDLLKNLKIKSKIL